MYVRVIITCLVFSVSVCVCVIITRLFCLQTTLATFLARATTIPSPTVAMTTARRSGCVPCRARRSRKPRAAPSPPAYRIITPNIKARPPSQSSASLCLSPPPPSTSSLQPGSGSDTSQPFTVCSACHCPHILSYYRRNSSFSLLSSPPSSLLSSSSSMSLTL